MLGIAWDGTGYGEDGSLWGGEFLVCDYKGYERAFYFRPFRLIGGERAVKEPRRVALSLLFELYREDATGMSLEPVRSFREEDLKNLYIAWSKGINSPYSSSVGRLFDAVASLIGLRQVVSYEGQGAMMLEDLYDPLVKDHYPYALEKRQIDWRPMLEAIIKDKERGKIPSRFINTLAHVCLHVAKELGMERVCLSGGVMQNDPLVSKIKELLEAEGFKVYTHQRVPPNDGGASLLVRHSFSLKRAKKRPYPLFQDIYRLLHILPLRRGQFWKVAYLYSLQNGLVVPIVEYTYPHSIYTCLPPLHLLTFRVQRYLYLTLPQNIQYGHPVFLRYGHLVGVYDVFLSFFVEVL